jgi:hypothetical protein
MKMSNYTMTDKKWDANKSKISEWLKVNVMPKDRIAFINYAFAEGDANPDMRKNWWGTVCSAFRDVVNSPIVKGQRSTLPDGVSAIIKKEIGELTSEIAAIFSSMPRFVHYTMKHGKSGGGPYGTASEMSEAIGEKVARLLTNAYTASAGNKMGKSFYWDGKSLTDDGLPAYEFVPKVVEQPSTEESEE